MQQFKKTKIQNYKYAKIQKRTEMQQSKNGQNTKVCAFFPIERGPGGGGEQTQKQPPNATRCTWWWWWCWFKNRDWRERWHHWQNYQQVAVMLTLIMSVSGDNDASLSMVKLAAKKIFINEISLQKRTKLKFSKTSYKNMKHICLSLCETKANNSSLLEVRLHVDLIPALLTQKTDSCWLVRCIHRKFSLAFALVVCFF